MDRPSHCAVGKRAPNIEGRPTQAAQLPQTLTATLYFFLSKADREAFIGDMQEEHSLAVERIGLRRAEIWYLKQVLTEIGPVMWPRIKKLARILGFTEAIRRWIGS